MLSIFKEGFHLTLILYIAFISDRRAGIFVETLRFTDGSNIDLLSRKLQVDFMSELYAESSSKHINETVVTVKPSTAGSAYCSPSEDVFVEAVLVDFKSSIFNSRHFSSISKVAIYVIDKHNQEHLKLTNQSSSFVVTVDGKNSLLSNKSDFRMSATVAAGGRSVFLLPNKTGLICVYFPLSRRPSLGIFGVVWGTEDVDDDFNDMQRVEEISLRRRRSLNDSSSRPLDLGKVFDLSPVPTDVATTKEPDHPRYMLKERKARRKSKKAKKNRKTAKSLKKTRSKGRYTKSRVKKNYSRDIASQRTSSKSNPKRGFKYRRRRKRRQNHHHHRHKSSKTEAEVLRERVTTSTTTVEPLIGLYDDPAIKSQSCQLHKLPVKLSELGWKRVIIAPEIVDISYCSGICSAAKTPTKMSNQAMLLQLFKLVRGSSLPRPLPEPHCVPKTYSSLTLLYYDENENIVLKNYPNMVASSCGCR